MPKKSKRNRAGEMLSKSLNGSNKFQVKQKKEEKSPADEVFETLKNKVNNISEITELNETIESINKLKNGGNNQGQQQMQSFNVLQQLKEAGLPIDNILNLNQEQTQKLNQMLNEERQARLESEEKAIEAKKENESNQMDLVMKLMEMQEKRQEKELENFQELIKDLKNEVKNNQSQNEEEDPVKKKAYDVLLNKFEEEVNQDNPDPFESIAYNKQRLEQLKEMFGANQDNDFREIDKKQMNLEHQLEMKKIEMKDKRKREEMNQEKELQEQKIQKWDSLMSTLEQIAPAVINQITNNNNNPSGNPQNNVTKGMNAFICRDCGQQMAGKIEEPPNKCPNCGSNEVVNAEAVQ